MSDGDSGARRPEEDFDVTGAEFGEFLGEKMPGAKCPACGSEDPPTIAADSADSVVHVVGSPMMTPRKGATHPVCIAFCQNCGFAWQFWANIVLGWAIDRRKGDGDDG